MIGLLLAAMLLAADATPPDELPTAATLPAADDARLAALVTDPRLAEMSGLAASARHPAVLWTHNDSGDDAVLHAMSASGELQATLTLSGVDHVDFEDLAGFDVDGEPHLLVADTGDNGGIRRELQLHVIREPDALVDSAVPVAWTLRFRWPDGPRDCEAVAVDARRGEILLISKKRVPAELFRLPLRPRGKGVLTAEPIGSLTGIAQPTGDDLIRNPRFGRYRAQITAMDISRDGRQLAVLNYRRAYLYRRDGNDGWGQAIRRRPRGLGFPWLAQAEAIAFSADGTHLWISSEHLPAPLLRLAVPDGR